MKVRPHREIPHSATDENWAPPDYQKAALYFHCPATTCDGFIKVPNRNQDHRVTCEKCSLRLVICADKATNAGRLDFWRALLWLLAGLLLGAAGMRLYIN